jgi:nicotinamidase/pyrazinamidase
MFGDALLVVDMQRDFLPGGSLGVRDGDRVLAPVNRCIDLFVRLGLPVFASRDWHPPDHCSFRERGGPWPVHCVAGSAGAEFDSGLRLPTDVPVVSKATRAQHEAYSAFSGTDLRQRLEAVGAKRLFVAGLATDYCVLQTALDALRQGLQVILVRDAIAAVDAQPGDGERALAQMARAGAGFVDSARLRAPDP